MPQVSSKVKSGRQSQGRKNGGGGRSRQSGDPEAQPLKKNSEKDQDIGLPRLVARIWGLVSGICKYSIFIQFEMNLTHEFCQAIYLPLFIQFMINYLFKIINLKPSF